MVGGKRVFLTLVAVFAIAGGAPEGASAAETVKLERLSHIHGLTVDRTDPARILLATHQGLFAATADGLAVRLSKRADDFMGFAPHPVEAGVFYASGHPQGGGNLGVLRSADGGLTWSQWAKGAGGPTCLTRPLLRRLMSHL